ncbi:F0F1 ATP synthase subunit gamma [Patescibacteria group bacterium]
MKSIRQQQDRVDTLKGFFNLIESYEEIAAIRMRKVRMVVLQNREYLEGINEIYGLVASVYETYLSKISRKKIIQNKVRPNNGKTVSIFLSSNIGLYGDVIRKSLDLFVKETQDKKSDIVIVGRLGRDWYKNLPSHKKFTYFEFSDSGIDRPSLEAILKHILKYKEIEVYHGIFRNILAQVPKRTSITGDLSKYKEKEVEKTLEKVLFEPSVGAVMAFFEEQILSIFFDQVVNESSLSKFASRMINLDFAVARIDKQIEKANLTLKKMKHTKLNKDQLSVLSGITLWK